MATVDWSECPLVEIIPGKVSGAPLLKGTRLPVEAVTGNYDAFRAESLSPEAAIAETQDCYPEVSVQQLGGRSFAVLILSAINWPVVRPHVEKIAAAIVAGAAGYGYAD
jgi:uncharacterized protein (DUF433 family)